MSCFTFSLDGVGLHLKVIGTEKNFKAILQRQVVSQWSSMNEMWAS
jgi:hypothetical protein